MRKRPSSPSTAPSSLEPTSPPSTTIHSLPPEVLSIIFKCGVNRADWRRKDYHTFWLNAALVCSRWTEEARALIWDSVYVQREVQAQRMLNSAALGRYQTRTMELACWPNDSPLAVQHETARKILARVQGLVELELNGFDRANTLDSGVCCFPNLSTLKSLSLYEVSWRRNDSDLPKPSFSLTYLDLDCSGGTALNELAFFSHGTLAQFRLYSPVNLDQQTLHDNLLPFLESVSPALQTLELAIGQLLHLLPAFGSFSSLNCLILECTGAEFSTLVRLLPSDCKLKTVSILMVAFDISEELMRGIREVLRSAPLTLLSGFVFPLVRRAQVEEIATGKEVVALLEKRGVVVEFG